MLFTEYSAVKLVPILVPLEESLPSRLTNPLFRLGPAATFRGQSRERNGGQSFCGLFLEAGRRQRRCWRREEEAARLGWAGLGESCLAKHGFVACVNLLWLHPAASGPCCPYLHRSCWPLQYLKGGPLELRYSKALTTYKHTCMSLDAQVVLDLQRLV